MISLKAAVFGAATLLASVARADYVIDPDTVPLATRDSWCTSETSVCPLICTQISTGEPEVNTCDPTTLTYGCTCGNGLQPNVSQYTLTIPYYTCTQWVVQCSNSCGNDNTCASDCTQNHPCGAQDPPKSNKTTTSSTMAATASSTSASAGTIYTGLAGGNSGSSSSSGAASVSRIAGMMGSVSLVGGVAVFAFLL